MDLKPILHDLLQPSKVAFWWTTLSTDQKFQFACAINNHLQLAADKYCERIDPSDLYCKLTHKYRYFLDDLAYPVDWNMDLHMDSENYENFTDCMDDIVSGFAQSNIDWFCEIFPLVPEMKSAALIEMIIRYFEELPVWKD